MTKTATTNPDDLFIDEDDEFDITSDVASLTKFDSAREQYLRFIDLYPALLTVMRAIENGHPVGHDAVVAARRALKVANGNPRGKLDLSCRCTVCSKQNKRATV